MRYRYSRLMLPIQVIADFLMLNMSFFAAFYMQFKNPAVFGSSEYLILLLTFNLIWMASIPVVNPYQISRVVFNLDNLLSKFFLIVFLHICIISIAWVVVGGNGYSRAHLFLTYGLFLIAGVVWRISALVFLKIYRMSGYNYRNYIIVGNTDVTKSVKTFYEAHPEMGYRFLGFFSEAPSDNPNGKTLWDLEDFILNNHLDYIYCNLSSLSPEALKKTIEISEKLKVKVNLILDYRGFLTNRAAIEYHDYMPVISLSTKPFSNIQTEVFKRMFDVGFSFVAIMLCLPIMLIIAVAVKLTSKGPVFFSQERSGRWGKRFRIYKFRSMYINTKTEGKQHSRGKGDPRITSIGGFLRQTRLDELPQFFNVLKGDMSIVGPRPLARYDVDMLMDNAPENFKKILTIRPGITSIGQIKVGYADNLETSVRRMKYDLLYIRNASLGTDIWLIFQTVKVMLLARGR